MMTRSAIMVPLGRLRLQLAAAVPSVGRSLPRVCLTTDSSGGEKAQCSFSEPVRTRRIVTDASSNFDGVERIAYWTDAEGNLDYFNKLLKCSRALYKQEDGSLGLHDGCGFVYGGDAIDKGIGDIRIVTMLCQLKDDYPDRVILLMGNRDVNKMRFAAELHETDLAMPDDHIISPYYLGDRGLNPSQWYDQKWPLDWSSAAEQDRCIYRLQYILEHTMNSPNAFEFRRRELELLSTTEGRDSDPVTDMKVFSSFRDSVLPGGICYEYLSRAQLAATVGNTLFLHGAVTIPSMGFVPCPQTTVNEPREYHEVRGSTHDNVHDWIHGLEGYAATSLRNWIENPQWDAQRKRRGGEGLMAYAHFRAMAKRTAMVSSFLDDGNLADVDASVVEFLNGSGIERVIVGHKPWGDSPGIIRSNPGLEVICADTSFSDMRAQDNRGVAASEVLIEGDPRCNNVAIHGTLSTGHKIDFELPPRAAASPQSSASVHPAEAVGTQFDDGYWVKAILNDRNEHLLSRGKGFDIDYKICKT